MEEEDVFDALLLLLLLELRACIDGMAARGLAAARRSANRAVDSMVVLVGKMLCTLSGLV